MDDEFRSNKFFFSYLSGVLKNSSSTTLVGTHQNIKAQLLNDTPVKINSHSLSP